MDGMTRSSTAPGPAARTRAERVARALESLPIETPGLMDRLRAVHAWAECGARPPPATERPDIEALAVYGLCYLAATAAEPRVSPALDAEVHYRRAYFRQAIDAARYHTSAPAHVRSMIDRSMAAMRLSPRYDWSGQGLEVIVSWTPRTGAAFLPLAVCVEAAVRSFLALPDDASSRREIDQWERGATTYAGLIGRQALSPCHGERIRRVLGCYALAAERHRIPALAEAVARIARDNDLDLPVPADLAATVRDLEIELELRAAAAARGASDEDRAEAARWRRERTLQRRRRRRGRTGRR